jgi:hypothetical protein
MGGILLVKTKFNNYYAWPRPLIMYLNQIYICEKYCYTASHSEYPKVLLIMKRPDLLLMSLAMIFSLHITACGPAANTTKIPTPFQSSTGDPPIGPTPSPDLHSVLPAISAYALLPNGGLAFLTSDQKSIGIQTSSNAKIQNISSPEGRIQKIVASPDGKRLLALIVKEGAAPAAGTVSEQAQLAVLELETMQINTIEGAKIADYSSLPQWYPNSQQFVYIDLERRLHRYDLASVKDHLVSEQDGLTRPLISPDGKNIIVTYFQVSIFAAGPGLMNYRQPLRQVFVFDAEEKMQTLTPSIDESNRAEFVYPNGNILVSRFKDGKQSLIKLNLENQIEQEIPTLDYYDLAGKPSPNGENLLIESSTNISDALSPSNKTYLFINEQKTDKRHTLIDGPLRAIGLPDLIYQAYWLNDDVVLFLRDGKIVQYVVSTQKESLYR